MRLKDFEALGRDLAASLKGYVDASILRVEARLAAIPAGAPGEKGEPGEPGRDGKDGAAGQKGDPGRDGRDGTNGRDGNDGKDGARGEKGLDGIGIERVELGEKSFDLVLTDGSRAEVPLVQGPRGERGENGKDGALGLHGKDGRDGNDGKDGAPGPRGEKGDPPTQEEVEATMRKLLPALLRKEVDDEMERRQDTWIAKAALLVPAGRDGLPGRPGDPGADGRDGKDGRDGFSLKDLRMESRREGRELVFKFDDGERVQEHVVKTPTVIFRGLHKSGQSYEAGDCIQYGGHMWIALRDTDKTPPADDWKLAVRRGRDGRESSE
jgi:integrin beta 3